MLTLGIRILEGIFAAGLLGCVAVLLLSAVDDARVLFSGDSENH